MTLHEVAERLGLTVCAGAAGLDRDVAGGYAGDLLSDVMAHSAAGQVWITMQTHVNSVAVAVLKEHAGIILVNGRTPAADTARKADEEGVPILSSPIPSFEICGRLHEFGVGCHVP